MFTAATATYSHECDHGFCTICGTVWPCSRAARTGAIPVIPLARTDYFD